MARAVAEGELPSAAGIVDFPNGKPFELVFHGGSGSRPEEIAEAVSYGVIKMNIDTDTSTPSPVQSPTTCSRTTTRC